MTANLDVIVIGTGEAARPVAYTCRKAGRSVAAIDSLPFGGTCELRGCDPKKVLVWRPKRCAPKTRPVPSSTSVLYPL